MDIAKPSQSKVKSHWCQFGYSKRCVPLIWSLHIRSLEKSCPVKITSCMSKALLQELHEGPGDVDLKISPKKYSFIFKCNVMNGILNKVFRVRTTLAGDNCYWRAWTCYDSKVSQNPALFTSFSSSASAWLLSLPGTSSFSQRDQTLLYFFRLSTSWRSLSTFPLVQRSYSCLKDFNLCQYMEPNKKQKILDLSGTSWFW